MRCLTAIALFVLLVIVQIEPSYGSKVKYECQILSSYSLVELNPQYILKHETFALLKVAIQKQNEMPKSIKP